MLSKATSPGMATQQAKTARKIKVCYGRSRQKMHVKSLETKQFDVTVHNLISFMKNYLYSPLRVYLNKECLNQISSLKNLPILYFSVLV